MTAKEAVPPLTWRLTVSLGTSSPLLPGPRVSLPAPPFHHPDIDIDLAGGEGGKRLKRLGGKNRIGISNLLSPDITNW